MSRVYSFRIFVAGIVLLSFTGILHALPASPLTPVPTSVSLTFQKPSTPGSGTTVSVTGDAAGTFFSVDPTSIPMWLKVTPISGVATDSTPVVLTFQASPAWTTLGSGTFSSTVNLLVSGSLPLPIPVSALIADAAPAISVKGGTSVLTNVNWTINTASPALSMTLVSAMPMAFTAVASSTATTTGGVANWLSFSSSQATGTPPVNLSGMSYSWGTAISLSIAPLALQQAQVGDTLTGQVVINGSITVGVTIKVNPPPPVVTGVYPTTVPLITGTVTAGTVMVVLNGTGFVAAGSTPSTVFLNGVAVSASNVSVLSTNTIAVAVPYGTDGTPFKTAGTAVVTLGVANGSSPANPTANSQLAKLNVTAAPIITTITSASTFAQAAQGTNPTFAPYDIVSIFGSNFCALCTGSAATLVGAPDASGRYATYLTPDPGSTSHKVTVQFIKTSTSGSAWSAFGYLLFATANQINVLVPSGVSTLVGTGTVKVQVAYDTASTPTAANTSAPYVINIANTDPGIFTLGSNGTGQGAILNPDYSVNSASAPALMDNNGSPDIVMIYMTGLGVPNSTGTNVASGGCLAPLGAPGTTTAAPTGYMGTVNTSVSTTAAGYAVPSGYTPPNPAWTTIDGAVIKGSLLTVNTGVKPPCYSTGAPTVSIGGAAAAVTYAGFVSDSIVGLYQVNATVPTTLTTNGDPTSFPVVVTFGSGQTAVSSQLGATMYVQ